jgi:glycosyltransferase involved in cell wall biosynthesis
MATSAIRAADLVARKRGDFCLALAGDGSQRAAIEALADEVNRRHGRTVVHVLGHVDNVAALFRQADAVLGIGRGLWEGMAFGKPALVVGRMGLAGVVRPETVEELGYYNFAGRNATEPVPPERLAEELERILADDAYARGLGDFARRFILETFDAAVGAAQMERVVAAEVARGRLTCRQRLACLPGLAAMLLKEARTTAGGLVRKLTGRRAAPRDETP